MVGRISCFLFEPSSVLFLSEALIIILYHMLDPIHQVNLQFQEVETLGILL